MEFSWDFKKNEANFKKHKVWFEEAVGVFDDPLSVLMSDFCTHEERWIRIGKSYENILMFVSFIEYANGNIRIISARTLTKMELKNYEEGI